MMEGFFLLQIRWKDQFIGRMSSEVGGGGVGCRVSPFSSLNSWRLV